MTVDVGTDLVDATGTVIDPMVRMTTFAILDGMLSRESDVPCVLLYVHAKSRKYYVV